MTRLRFPGLAAVARRDDGAKRSHGPTVQRILGREYDRKKMIAYAGFTKCPLVAAVCSRHHDAPCAGDYDARAILDVHAVQRRVGGA